MRSEKSEECGRPTLRTRPITGAVQSQLRDNLSNLTQRKAYLTTSVTFTKSLHLHACARPCLSALLVCAATPSTAASSRCRPRRLLVGDSCSDSSPSRAGGASLIYLLLTGRGHLPACFDVADNTTSSASFALLRHLHTPISLLSPPKSCPVATIDSTPARHCIPNLRA